MEIRNNLLAELKKKYLNDLLNYYDEKEAEQLLTILIEHFFEISRNELIINSQNGILIPPGKISLLSTTLERILQNEKKLKAFSKQARFSVINKCSSHKIFNILLKIYINIVSN